MWALRKPAWGVSRRPGPSRAAGIRGGDGLSGPVRRLRGGAVPGGAEGAQPRADCGPGQDRAWGDTRTPLPPRPARASHWPNPAGSWGHRNSGALGTEQDGERWSREANAKGVGKRPMQGPWDGSPHPLEPALQQTGCPVGSSVLTDRPLRAHHSAASEPPHCHPPPLRQPPPPTTPVREAPHLPQGRLPQTPNNGQSKPGARRAEIQAQGLRPQRSQHDSAPRLQSHGQPAWDPGPEASG